MFASLTDERLIQMLHDQASACELVMAMPEGERRRPGPKGQASPEQSATMNAMFAQMAERECVRRGLLPEITLEVA